MIKDRQELEAGVRMLEEDRQRARTAVERATGRRERKSALEQLERAESALKSGQSMLARELRKNPQPTVLQPQHSGDFNVQSISGQRTSSTEENMTLSAARQMMLSFGSVREEQGDWFNDYSSSGYYSYVTNQTLTGIAVWGREDLCTISIFSCARAGMRPDIELWSWN